MNEQNVKPTIDHKNDTIRIDILDSKGNDIDMIDFPANELSTILPMLVLSCQTSYNQYKDDKAYKIIADLITKGYCLFKNYSITVEERRFDLDIQYLTLGFCEDEYYRKQADSIKRVCLNCQNFFIHHLDTEKDETFIHCSEFDAYCYEIVNSYFRQAKYLKGNDQFLCIKFNKISL